MKCDEYPTVSPIRRRPAGCLPGAVFSRLAEDRMAAQRVRQRTLSSVLAACIGSLAAEHAAWAQRCPGFRQALQGVRPDRFGFAAAPLPQYGLSDDNAGVVRHSPRWHTGDTVYYWLLRLPLWPAATPQQMGVPAVVAHAAAFAGVNPVGAAAWRALPGSPLNRSKGAVWQDGSWRLGGGSAAVSAAVRPRSGEGAVLSESAPVGVPYLPITNTFGGAAAARVDAGWFLSVFTTGDWRFGQVRTSSECGGGRGSGLFLDFPGPDWGPDVTVAALRDHVVWEFARLRRCFDSLDG